MNLNTKPQTLIGLHYQENDQLTLEVYPGHWIYEDIAAGYGEVGKDFEVVNEYIWFKIGQLEFDGRITGRIHVLSSVSGGIINPEETLKEGMARHRKRPECFTLTTKYTYPK